MRYEPTHRRGDRRDDLWRATESAGALDADPVLELQRTAGNAATAALLRRWSPPKANATVLARVNGSTSGGATATPDLAAIPGRKFHMSASDGRPPEHDRLLEFVKNRVPEKSRNNASQAVNDATSGTKGKDSGKLGDWRVLHASSGNGQTSCTVFFIRAGDVVSLLATGYHETSATYRIHWAAPGGAAKYPVGKVVGPAGAA